MTTKVTLAQIWKADVKDMAPILASQGRAPSADMNLNRVSTAIIYTNAKVMDPTDAVFVANPRFVAVMSKAASLESGLKELATPSSAVLPTFGAVPRSPPRGVPMTPPRAAPMSPRALYTDYGMATPAQLAELASGGFDRKMVQTGRGGYTLPDLKKWAKILKVPVSQPKEQLAGIILQMTSGAMPEALIPSAIVPPVVSLVKPTPTIEPSKTLADHFERLGKLYEGNRETFKARAFLNAANAVRSAGFEASSANLARIKTLKGVGKSSYEEAIEYFQSGVTKRLRDLEAIFAVEAAVAPPLGATAAPIPGIPALLPPSMVPGPPDAALVPLQTKQQVLELFRSVYGIGAVKADELYNAGHRSIDDLRKIASSLTAAQQAGVTYYADLRQRVPRAEIDEYIRWLVPIFGPQEGDAKHNAWTVAGSYRRGEPDSGDIDIIVRNDHKLDLADVVAKLQGLGLIEVQLAQGPVKFMGIVRLPPGADGKERVARRLDIRLFEPDTWAYALLYNTGSYQLNILMRQVAQAMGGRLSEYSLTNIQSGGKYPAKTEQDIFAMLNLKYLAPNERTKDLTTLALA